MAAWWLHDGEVGLERAVPSDLEPKHRAAQHHRVDERSTRDVLDDVRQFGEREHLPEPGDQIGSGLPDLAGVLATVRRELLARRRCPDERVASAAQSGPVNVLHHVAAREVIRVVRLMLDVDPMNVEAGVMETLGRATCLAE